MDQMFDRVLNELMCLYNSWIEEYNTVDIVLFSGNQIADTEAAVRRCSSKQVFLQILQYSQGNTCVGVSIQSECGKIQTRKTPNTDTFYAV